MKPLTRFSVTAAIVLATLGGLAIAYFTSGGAMFSPGPLNAEKRSAAGLRGVHSHADLSDNCAACHAPPWGHDSMASRCQDCHVEIRRQIASQQPLHGRLTDAQSCRNCHTEHKGPRAELTSFARFDHNATAFKLTGKHQDVACAKCHIDQTYKGTAQSCVACHADPPVHKGRFGENCATCHNTSSWTDHARFDHNATAFKLTGKHLDVACAQCHIDQKFKGTSQSCVACHADPPVHKGRFGDNCASCHNTSTWKGATFAHEFPLNHGGGKRRNLDCRVCHTIPGDYKAYTCYGCHEHEPAKIARKHRKIEPAKLEHCFNCHPGGHERRERRFRAGDSQNASSPNVPAA